MTSIAAGHLTRRNRLRAVAASTVGTTIEWYDFFLYGTAAAPAEQEVTGTRPAR